MPFWIFKRGFSNLKRLNNIEKTLHNSFSNVKEDITNLTSWIHDFKEKHTSHEKRLTKIEEMLEHFLTEIYLLKSEKEVSEINQEQIELEESLNQLDMLEELTETQKSLFATIFTLQNQMGTDKVSLKSIAKIAYPDKNYLKIRSTLSEYLTILESLGLVKKKRKGKEAYISITDLGKNLIQNIKKEKILIKNTKKDKKL
jgi:DNA-binding transcriptional ArsR family regulator